APPSRGSGPRRDHVRHRGILLRPDVLPGGGRRALRAPLPGRRAPPVLGRRGSRRERRGGAPAPRAATAGFGTAVARVPRRQPELRAGGTAVGHRGRAGLDPVDRPDPPPPVYGPTSAEGRSVRPGPAADPAPAGAGRADARPRGRPRRLLPRRDG